GSYHVLVTVSISGVSHSLSSSFTVTAPPQPPFRLTFTNLKLTDGAGHAITTSRANKRVEVHAMWSTSASASDLTVVLTETLQYRSGKAWKALGSPLITSFQASAGKRQYTFSFVPSSSFSQLRVAIALAIDGKTQRRTAVLHVSK
ncbi:MAG TPA: hypothetical protein VG222_10505, partial [Vicinamibacterales bacterium]|nr:hypothetical protein [Vicinamibacterales bacterium]